MKRGFIPVNKIPEVCVDCKYCVEIDEGTFARCGIVESDKDPGYLKEIEDYCQDRPGWCPIISVENIPEKVKRAINIRKFFEGGDPIAGCCPTCNAPLFYRDYIDKVCWRCGQLLDWSDWR